MFLLYPMNKIIQPTFNGQKNKLGIPAKEILAPNGQSARDYIKQKDSTLDDLKGYFEDLLRYIDQENLPVGFRMNKTRKTEHGGCYEATQIRGVTEDDNYGGEIKTLVREIGKSGELVFAHLPASEQVHWKGKIQSVLSTLGVNAGKNALKSNASIEKLEELNFGYLGNGLMNPFSSEVYKNKTKIYHLFDGSLLDLYFQNKIVSTNAGTREAGSFFETEEIIDYIKKVLQPKGQNFQNLSIGDILV